VHVENQVRCDPRFDGATQQQARQKTFAGSTFAKHAIGTLDEAIEVDTNGHVHVEGAADFQKCVAFS
jgi:hypothetical protein